MGILDSHDREIEEIEEKSQVNHRRQVIYCKGLWGRTLGPDAACASIGGQGHSGRIWNYRVVKTRPESKT